MLSSLRNSVFIPLAGSLLCVALAPIGFSQPPNVLLILSDDQGTVDIDAFGAHDLHTPQLNRLAGKGVRFTQFYVGAPVCSPSRAALLTGRFPHRAGVPSNVGLEAEGLPAEQTTIAEMLKEAGYATGIVGKWHLGEVNGKGPLDQGFDSFFGHMRGCIDNYSHFFYWSGPNVHDLWRNGREVYESGTHFSDLMVEEAKEFIDDSDDEPFFLYLPFNIPHYPLQGTENWREYYERDVQRQMPENRFHYAALVSTLDERVGQVLDFLERSGKADDTLVIFLSDHGHSTEERAMFGGGSAGPYRGSKFSLFEGGVRVPAIAVLPGVIPADETRDQLATSLDLLPTIADLTGASLPSEPIDGRSLKAVLNDAAAPSPHDVFHWQVGEQWAVREGRWKLVVNGRDTDRTPLKGADRVFLSDLDEDPGESQNLAAENSEVVERLTALHEEWAEDVGAGK